MNGCLFQIWNLFFPQRSCATIQSYLDTHFNKQGNSICISYHVLTSLVISVVNETPLRVYTVCQYNLVPKDQITTSFYHKIFTKPKPD